jgi:hypothetical protein
MQFGAAVWTSCVSGWLVELAGSSSERLQVWQQSLKTSVVEGI